MKQQVGWVRRNRSTGIDVKRWNILNGILIIRLLPTHEYALYTLANTILGTMIVLADGGISSSVMAQGGKVWQDRKKLGTVLSTAFMLRRKFGAIALIIAVPFLFYLCSLHNASALMSLKIKFIFLNLF